jgi:peptidoglycan/xylan/chitin deacetylase (PgdA/CDA1 family)
MPEAAQVPPPRSRAYYVSKHYAHRLQATIAWRSSGGFAAWRSGVRILLYHRVSKALDELAVSPEAFRRQMEAALASGARPVDLTTAVAALENGSTERLVCVTFDDAYHDNLDQALPVLRQLGIPATIFVPTGIIDGSARLYWYAPGDEPPVLSWDELAEIATMPLVAVGAHSVTHRALPALSDQEAWEEISGSKRILEARLGRPVTSFSYPAGLYGDRELRMLREAGYSAALTTEPGLNCPGQPLDQLHRMIIDRLDSLRMFEAKLSGALDRPWGVDTLRLTARRRAAPSRSSGPSPWPRA